MSDSSMEHDKCGHVAGTVWCIYSQWKEWGNNKPSGMFKGCRDELKSRVSAIFVVLPLY